MLINAGKDETPPVRGVCGCSFLGISWVGSWLSCSDSILLFVPCGPGSVRGCESISAILLCHIAFSLVPVGHHRWARLFWLVAGTNARGCSFGCIYASWLGRFWSLFLVLFCFYVFFDKGGLIVFITTMKSTPLFSTPAPSLHLHSTMMSMTRNCSPFSKHLRNGDTTLRDLQLW